MYLLGRLPRIPKDDLIRLAAKVSTLPEITGASLWSIVTFYIACVHGPFNRRFYPTDPSRRGRGNVDDPKWGHLCAFPDPCPERRTIVMESCKPRIRNVLLTWLPYSNPGADMSAVWREAGLVDEDMREETVRKTRVVRKVFPRLEEECAAVARYYIGQPTATRYQAEWATIWYILEQYTNYHLCKPTFYDLTVVPRMKYNLDRCGIGERRYAVMLVGTDLRILLRKILPEDMDPVALERFWYRHDLHVLEEFDEEMKAALAWYRETWPNGGTGAAELERVFEQSWIGPEEEQRLLNKYT